MAALRSLLLASGLGHAIRSRIRPEQALDRTVLVLDTMGELGECYAGATWAFVGTDHNVLEPLAYGRPVFVSGQWQTVYPSYPVYREALAQGLIVHVERIEQLGQVWLDAASRREQLEAEQRRRVDALIASDQGRIEPNLDLVFRLLPLRPVQVP
jgi:3-deoxy-D-manno-octulosonic-acid transferase